MVDRDLNILFASENMSEQLGPLQVCRFIAVCMGGDTVMHWGRWLEAWDMQAESVVLQKCGVGVGQSVCLV